MPLSSLMAREDRFYSYDDGEDEEDSEDNDDEDCHRDDDDDDVDDDDNDDDVDDDDNDDDDNDNDDDDDDDEVATPKSTATHDAEKFNMEMTLSKRGWRDLSCYIETPIKMQKVGLAMLKKSSKLQY